MLYGGSYENLLGLNMRMMLKFFIAWKIRFLRVFKLQDLEQTDKKIEELVKKQYDTIIVSNDVASFSENIIKKYSKMKKLI